MTWFWLSAVYILVGLFFYVLTLIVDSHKLGKPLQSRAAVCAVWPVSILIFACGFYKGLRG